jgi:hypothetical protein
MVDWLGDIERLTAAVCALGALILGITNSNKIKEVHISINSRMDQLLKATGEAAKAAGAAQERSDVAERAGNETVGDKVRGTGEV